MIVCSAIKFKNKKTNETLIIPGVRHFDCFTIMVALCGMNYKEIWEHIEQGFLTHKSEFLNRKDAYAHAVNIGQISSEADIEWSKKYAATLYSEMLF